MGFPNWGEGRGPGVGVGVCVCVCVGPRLGKHSHIFPLFFDSVPKSILGIADDGCCKEVVRAWSEAHGVAVGGRSLPVCLRPWHRRDLGLMFPLKQNTWKKNGNTVGQLQTIENSDGGKRLSAA